MDWRKLLFPEANDKTFADGYAQAVTFGLLMARAKGIRLATGFEQVSRELAHTSSLIGAALRLLTDNAENQATLKTSLGTLTRVLDAVHWPTISTGNPETCWACCGKLPRPSRRMKAKAPFRRRSTPP